MKPVRVVVTGLGCICAAGNSLEQTMRSLYAGRRRPAASTRFRLNLGQTYPVFEVPGELKDLYETQLRREPTRTTQLALIAAEEALRQAGLEMQRFLGNDKRIGRDKNQDTEYTNPVASKIF